MAKHHIFGSNDPAAQECVLVDTDVDVEYPPRLAPPDKTSTILGLSRSRV